MIDKAAVKAIKWPANTGLPRRWMPMANTAMAAGSQKGS
jgi:hypothetical protein